MVDIETIDNSPIVDEKLMQKMLQNVKKTHHRVVILKVSNNDTS